MAADNATDATAAFPATAGYSSMTRAGCSRNSASTAAVTCSAARWTLDAQRRDSTTAPVAVTVV